MVSVCIYYIKKIKIKIGFNMSYKDIMQQDLELNFALKLFFLFFDGALKLFVRGITLNKLNTVHE